MKAPSILLLLVVSFLFQSSFSQIQKVETIKYITIGKWKSGGKTLSEMFYSVDDSKDTIYHWMYQDARYSSIAAYEWIVFSEEGNTLNDLYSILKECMEKDKGHETSFKLEKI